MLFLVLALSALLIEVQGILHIDRVLLENNKKCNNVSEIHEHDKTGNAVVTLDIKTFDTVSKMLLYIKVNLAKDENDDLCRREFLRTVMDVNKLIEGAYGNVLIKGFLASFISQVKALNITIPLKPVSLI